MRKKPIKFLILATGCWLLATGICFAQPYNIAVVKSRSLPVYENAIQQIKDELKEVRFFMYDLEGEKAKGEKIFPEIRKQNVNLILTFGTLAAQTAKEKEKNLPIVFAYVLNPVASGLVPALESSEMNITGVALDVPIREQFENFRLVVPKIRNIAVLYNPAETGAVVAAAKNVAAEMGLNLNAIPVSDPEEVPRKLNLLKGADGLWMTADSVVFTPRNTEYILLYALKEGIPFMGASEQFVKAGALCGKALDLDSINRQTARQIKRVLVGENPANIPILLPEKIDLAVNLKAAERIGRRIPPSTMEKAGVVYK